MLKVLHKGVLMIVVWILFWQYIGAVNVHQSRQFRQYNVKDGLSHGSVNCIIQDPEGYMWVGTYNGLNRFDGYEFKAFLYNGSDTTSLSNSAVKCLLVDRNDNLWVGTYGGLNKYDPCTETFKRYLNVVNASGPITNNTIYSLAEGPDGNIWCGTWGGGLIKINPVTDQVERIDFSRYPFLNASANQIQNLTFDSSGILWICTWGDGLLKMDTHTNRIDKYTVCSDNNKERGSSFTWGFVEVAPGYFWVGTRFGKLYAFNASDMIFNEVVPELQTPWPEIEIDVLEKDFDGNIWLGTYGSGYYVYTPQNAQWSSHRYEKKRISSLSSNMVTGIYFSAKQRSTWVATSDGINMIDPHYKKFGLVSRYDFPDEVGSPESFTFEEGVNGQLIIGTRGSGVISYDPVKGQFLRNKYRYKYPAISDNNTLSLLCGGDNLYVGTRKGFNIIDTKTGQVKQVFSDYSSEGKLSSDYIRDIYLDAYGQLWLGTNAGLELYNDKLDEFKLYKAYQDLSPELLKNLVWTISEGPDEHLWVGTDGGGLCQFDPKNKRFLSKFTHANQDTSALSGNRVISLFSDSRERLWVGTANGLNLFDPQSRTFRSLTAKDGLRSDVVFAIEEDDNGNIWFSTAKTLVHFDPDNWKYIEFDYTDGIQEKEFHKEASIKLSSGYLVFGGIYGFNIFHPDSISFNTFEPPVVLTGMNIANQPVEDYQKEEQKSILPGALNHTDRIVLSHKENSLTFKFAALNFSLPLKNRYQYMLEGFDNGWIDNGNDRQAFYTNLPPGHYTFKVKGSNNDGYWNPIPKTINISIQPPLYQKNWFRVLVVLVIVLVVLGAFKYRTLSLARQKRMLEHLVNQKTRDLKRANRILEERQEEIQVQNEEILSQKDELDKHRFHLEELVRQRTKALEAEKRKAEQSEKLKSAFLANISHEIRTPMNAIIGFSNLLESQVISPDDRQQYLTYIRQNTDSLLVLIDDILDLSLIEAGTLIIRPEDFDLCELLKEITNHYLPACRERQLELHLMLNVENKRCFIRSDSNRIKQVLRNLMENALKFTDEGFIEIGASPIIQDNQEFVKIHVKDSGIGIADDQLDQIFNSFTKVSRHQERLYKGTGLGLAISKHIVELLGGSIWVESVPGEFSTFYFTLPLEAPG